MNASRFSLNKFILKSFVKSNATVATIIEITMLC